MKSLSVCPALLLGISIAAAPAPEDRLTPPLPQGVEARKNLAYVTNGHERQVLDLYVPKSDKPVPVVIWVHGGAWKAGSKENCPALRLLREGYAVASINYRMSQHAIFPAQIQDCKAAVRWLRAHAKEYKLDGSRFGAWGGSAGGHLVAMLAVTGDTKEFDVGENLSESSKVQAVVDYFGPTQLLEMQSMSGPESRMRHDTADSPESQLISGPLLKMEKEARAASPITYVTKGDTPMLLVHGDQDPLVSYKQSVVMDKALRDAGVECELVIVKGAGHGQGFGQPEFEKTQSFFARHLKL